MRSEKNRNRFSSAVFTLIILSSVAVWPALATTGNTTAQVTNTNDSGPGSLRQAIQSAQAGDTVVFSVSGTITLSSSLTIDKSLTISGPGSSNLAISGNNAVRVLIVARGTTVGVSGVTIENGSAANFGVSPNLPGGGGIYNAGTLTVTNSTVSGGGACGGGIYNDGGTLTLKNSTVSGGASIGGGMCIAGGTVTLTNSTVFGDNPSTGVGGIYVLGGTLILTNSTVFGNSTSTGGIYNVGGTLKVTGSAISGTSDGGTGGIYNGGTLTLINSRVSGAVQGPLCGGIANGGTLTMINSTVSDSGGGGICNFGTLTATNSTVSGNNSGEGGFAGGIFNDGTLTLINSTVSGNSNPGFWGPGGGIYNLGTLTLKNTILANNTAYDPRYGNCAGTGSSLGHNLSDDNSCSSFLNAVGDLNNILAGLDLGGLKNNGGPTQTIALLSTSPAVDAIPLSFCTAVDGTPITTDQRGLPRPQGLGCDIGAFEYLAIKGPAPTSGSTCNGAYNGTFNGNLTVSPGQNCVFFNGGVTGNVQQYGGSFVLFQSQVGSDVQVKGGGTFSVGPGSTINGNLQVQNLPNGSVQDQICGTRVTGDLQVQNNGTGVLIGGNPLSPCTGNTVGGNLQVQNNWASTSAVGNTVGGNLMDQNNSAPTQVFNNTVSGNLHCQNDTAIQGGGNTVAQQKQGQCSGF